MTLTDQVYAQAVMLAGVDEKSEALLQLFSRSAVAGLKHQLREGVKVDDCDWLRFFISSASDSAASAYKLAAATKSALQSSTFTPSRS